MSISVTFNCDGCKATAAGTKPLRSKFISITGRSHGFGSYKNATADEVAPEGWLAYDPYTRCCYCPDCTDEINKELA